MTQYIGLLSPPPGSPAFFSLVQHHPCHGIRFYLDALIASQLVSVDPILALTQKGSYKHTNLFTSLPVAALCSKDKNKASYMAEGPDVI